MKRHYTYPEIFTIPKFNLTVKGWSRGSQNTGFFIPELKLLLDAQSNGGFDAEFILITHGHTDHSAGLPMRVTCINTNPQIFIPLETKQFLVDYINATFRMGYCDSSYESKYNVIGVIPGELYSLKNGFDVKVYNMIHNVPCRGYGIRHTRTKLKTEYFNTPKNEIIALRKSGVVITEEINEPVIAYLTDTTHEIFKDPELFTYPYIMTECTFLPCREKDNSEKEIALANEAKHTHWNNIYPIIKEHPENTFILIHFSNRYTDEELIKFRDSITDIKNVIFAI
jgi:ribonuclease Z